MPGCKTCDPTKLSCDSGAFGCVFSMCAPDGLEGGRVAGVYAVGPAPYDGWLDAGICPTSWWCTLYPEVDADQCATDADCGAGETCAAVPAVVEVGYCLAGKLACLPTVVASDRDTSSPAQPLTLPPPGPPLDLGALPSCATPLEEAPAPVVPQGPCLAQEGARNRFEQTHAVVPAGDGGWRSALVGTRHHAGVSCNDDSGYDGTWIRLSQTGPDRVPRHAGLYSPTTTPTSSFVALATAPEDRTTLIVRYQWGTGFARLVAQRYDAGGSPACEVAFAGSDEPPQGSSAVDVGDGRVVVVWESPEGLELAEVDPCAGVVRRKILPGATSGGRAALGDQGLLQVPARVDGALHVLGVDRHGEAATDLLVTGALGVADVVGHGGAAWLVAGNSCNGTRAVARHRRER